MSNHENCNIHRPEFPPLFDHLRRYPACHRLILDFSAIGIPSQIRNMINAAFAREIDTPGDNSHDGIRDLRIQLAHQSILRSEHNSDLLSHLAQQLKLPNLCQIHIAMGLLHDQSTHFTTKGDAADTWMTAFKCLDLLAATWEALEVIKVCVRVMFLPKDSRFATWQLWVSKPGITSAAQYQRNHLHFIA